MSLENIKSQEIKEQNLSWEVWEQISEVSTWVSNTIWKYYSDMINQLAEKRKGIK